MLAHARFAKSIRTFLGQSTATATTQARILPEHFHGPDEPYECKKSIDPNRCLLRQTRFLSSALKKEERRAKRSLLILFRPQVFIPRRDV